ncbi:hypothetical protein [Roseobacter sp. N2S]|uniref:hypothetical protein n=1 Tax=Roseobacter sp. N2S TaxID=2663844 RepID=UPI00285C4440|nr:hypothetical protein [Roseobacter sp. N2S]MDR6266543.1 hypothetical protein [Roseobacter sp. N2S]
MKPFFLSFWTMPLWAPNDGGTPPPSAPPAGDPPAGEGQTPPAGDPPAGEGDTPPAGEPPAGEPKPKWFEGDRFNEDQRAYLNKRGLDQMDDPLDALQKTIEAHRNQSKVMRNGEENYLDKPAADQALADYRKANAEIFGVPEAPDKYALEKPDLPEGMQWNAPMEEAARKMAHDQGWSQEDFGKAVELYSKFSVEDFKTAEQEYAETNATMMDELTAKWGDASKQNMALASQAMDMIAREAGLGNDEIALMSQALKPKIGDASTIRIFAKLGEMMADDSMPGLGNGSRDLGLTPEAARQQLETMQGKDGPYGKALAAGDKAEMARLKPQRDRLIKIIAG